MNSPFPGMDPYLEDPRLWPDFHQRFITYWCDALIEKLPPSYEARMEDRIAVIPEGSGARGLRPDVAISIVSEPAVAYGPATVEEERGPIEIPLAEFDEIRQSRILILHGPGRKLVAVLELLSPSNKSGSDGYAAKRQAVLASAAHLIELDLLAAGERMALQKPLPSGHYFAFVARKGRGVCEVYAWTVRQRMPAMRIPLLAPDPDLDFPLQPVFQSAYEKGRYERSLDYTKPPAVSLPAGDLDWCRRTASTVVA